MPSLTDAGFVVLIAVVYPVWDYFVAWPRLKASLESGRPRAREEAYKSVLRLQWSAAGVLAGWWAWSGRPGSALGMVMPGGWRLAAGLALVAGLIWLFALQLKQIAGLPTEKRVALRARFAAVRLILPHNEAEYRWFQGVSVTAGICEELVYRGYLVWVLAAWCGLPAGAVLSMVCFGLAHAYQGKQGAVRAGLVGGTFGVLSILLGSIIPGMVLHAIVDLGGGATGYAILRGADADHAPDEIKG